MDRVTLTPATGAAQEATLTGATAGFSSAGYRSHLREGSRWKRLGAIPQGDVWKPLDTVLAAEGTHMHEAYMVVRGSRWVGFYLPVEGAYSPLESAIQVKLSQ